MKILPYIFFLMGTILVSNSAIAQDTTITIKQKPAEDSLLMCGIFETAAIPPISWSLYLRSQLENRISDTIPSGTYEVHVAFIIDRQGNIENAWLKKDPGHGIGQRAILAINAYKEKWVPATRNGRVVKGYYTYPLTITFCSNSDQE